MHIQFDAKRTNFIPVTVSSRNEATTKNYDVQWSHWTRTVSSAEKSDGFISRMCSAFGDISSSCFEKGPNVSLHLCVQHDLFPGTCRSVLCLLCSKNTEKRAIVSRHELSKWFLMENEFVYQITQMPWRNFSIYLKAVLHRVISSILYKSAYEIWTPLGSPLSYGIGSSRWMWSVASK